jgi:hypothetical protein
MCRIVGFAVEMTDALALIVKVQPPPREIIVWSENAAKRPE